MDYSIWIVSPPGYLHSHAFDEIALSLKNGFAELGFKVPIVRDAQEISGKAIVLGCNLLPHHKGALPRNLILFNLEQIQVGSPWLSPAYLELLKRYPVWDYSYHNMKVQILSPTVVLGTPRSSRGFLRQWKILTSFSMEASTAAVLRSYRN
jgi:hypothetical protein